MLSCITCMQCRVCPPAFPMCRYHGQLKNLRWSGTFSDAGSPDSMGPQLGSSEDVLSQRFNIWYFYSFIFATPTNCTV